MTGEAEVYAIRYGTLSMMRSHFFYDYAAYGEPDAAIAMDYLFFVIRIAGEIILVDCGFDPEVARRRGRTPLVSAPEGLAELGIGVDDVDRIVITHFHYDHIGNVGLFPNARLIAQHREAMFWSSPVASRPAFANVVEEGELGVLTDAVKSGRLEFVDGSTEIVPGLSVELLGGHTPGQQLVRIEMPHSDIVLASDALHCYEEIEKDRPFSIFTDLAKTYAAFDRLRDIQTSGATIIAGHDPLIATRFGDRATQGAPVALRIA